jgi:3-hydroxyacyl-[acyl-carrier-protein] dehydratase
MHFSLVDRVLESAGSPEGEARVVTLKLVSGAEEYLQDHFPTFPVLPGVFMLESMVQAARHAIDPEGSRPEPVVLGRVRALKYGRFVRPGDTMRVEVTLAASEGGWDCRGSVLVLDPAAPAADPSTPPPTACTGRFTMRPAILDRAD